MWVLLIYPREMPNFGSAYGVLILVKYTATAEDSEVDKGIG